MPLQELLEVAIGLIFAWLVLSMATLQVQETMADLFKWRSDDLEKAIRNMLGDEKKLKAFYNHQLIKSLSEPVTFRIQQSIRKVFGQDPLNKKPAYIPASVFATALFDVVANAGTEQSPIKTALSDIRTEIAKMQSGDEKSVANAALLKITKLAETVVIAETTNLRAAAATELIARIDKFGHENPSMSVIAAGLKTAIQQNPNDLNELLDVRPYLEQVRQGAVTEGNKALGSALNSLLAGVEEYATDTDKALAIGRKNVETWFNDSMDRLSGWYKRRAQMWAFVISFLAACLLNVDSVQLSIKLWQEPILRQATAGYVDHWMQEKKAEELSAQDIQTISRELRALKLPIGWDFYMWDAVPDPKAQPDANNMVPVICQQLDLTTPPVNGQPNEPKLIPPPANGAFLNKCTVILDLPKTTGDWWIKLLGLLISAGAAMQGAPFWFDILKKLVNVRASGINPAEKPKEEQTQAS